MLGYRYARDGPGLGAHGVILGELRPSRRLCPRAEIYVPDIDWSAESTMAVEMPKPPTTVATTMPRIQ